MPRNGKPTLGERMAIIETKFKEVVEPMAFKVGHIYDNLPEISRKVQQHHEMFQHHCRFIDQEIHKQTVEEARRKEQKSRKTDTRKFKLGIASLIVAIVSLILTNLWIILNLK